MVEPLPVKFSSRKFFPKLQPISRIESGALQLRSGQNTSRGKRQWKAFPYKWLDHTFYSSVNNLKIYFNMHLEAKKSGSGALL